MKQLISLITLILASFFYIPSSFANDNMSLRICEYVQANDKQRLRKYLKKKKVKIRNFYKDLRCNSDNILIFAARSKALDVGEFLLGQLPSKIVSSQIDAISEHSAHLAEKAKERVK